MCGRCSRIAKPPRKKALHDSNGLQALLLMTPNGPERIVTVLELTMGTAEEGCLGPVHETRLHTWSIGGHSVELTTNK